MPQGYYHWLPGESPAEQEYDRKEEAYRATSPGYKILYLLSLNEKLFIEIEKELKDEHQYSDERLIVSFENIIGEQKIIENFD